VLIEIGDSLGASDRAGAIDFIEMCYRATHVRVVRLTSELLFRGFALYKARPDKEWGLTDCISFIVMEGHGLTDALTADRHFVQAGFRGAVGRLRANVSTMCARWLIARRRALPDASAGFRRIGQSGAC
jgi:hypothetical protein